MTDRTHPKGFDCETCSGWHEFSMYVYAHTTDRLVHNCEWCGAQHSILNLRARQIKKGKLPKKAKA